MRPRRSRRAVSLPATVVLPAPLRPVNQMQQPCGSCRTGRSRIALLALRARRSRDGLAFDGHGRSRRTLRSGRTLLALWSGWALLAREWNYARPVLDDSNVLEIIDGRHPVVEQVLRSPDTTIARGAPPPEFAEFAGQWPAHNLDLSNTRSTTASPVSPDSCSRAVATSMR